MRGQTDGQMDKWRFAGLDMGGSMWVSIDEIDRSNSGR